MKKIKVAIIFGGRSAEHEVSIQSAKNVYEALNKDKYEIIQIALGRIGNSKEITSISKTLESIDVVFPVLHGPYGEDGTIQGMLKLLNIPFVGPSVLGSAVGMDKDVMKRLFEQAGIPTAKFLTFNKMGISTNDYEKIVKKLGSPFFMKPANLGSSVGVSKIKNKNDFSKALAEIFNYDNKIIIEEYIKGREIECSVLGNENPITSVPGEVIVKAEFYSYSAKYIDEDGATTEIPAKLSKAITKKVQDLAIKTFKTLCCEGMGRVDFFLTKSEKVFVNEINTIPGFTNISMYPKLWEASGISYERLIDRLIELALERHARDKKLTVSR